MDIIQFIKLIRKNLLVIFLVPIILTGIVIWGTSYQTKHYASSATIYTGISSGLSLESQANMRFDYMGSKMEFDNIVNLFKARETQREVALSLFIQGLSLKTWDPQYISRQSFNELQELVPQYVKDMVILPGNTNNTDQLKNTHVILNDTIGLKNKRIITKNKLYRVQSGETLFSISSKLGVSASDLMNYNTLTNTTLEPETNIIYGRVELLAFSNKTGKRDTIPLYVQDTNYYEKAYIDSASFEKTLKFFKEYYIDNDTNYIYKLLNYEHKFYSMDAISEMKARRIQGSDLLELSFQTTDPGICKQTLQFAINAFKKNYKKLKENQSDNVVTYFENMVTESNMNLQAAENQLLKFNQDNNIINYYEQTNHISQQKQILESKYYDELMISSAADSVLKSLEKRLNSQKSISRLNSTLLDSRSKLSEITYKIAVNELNNSPDPKTITAIEKLKSEQVDLRKKINQNIDNVFSLRFTKQGVNINQILSQWLTNLIIYEESQAKLVALKDRKSEFQRTYEKFAPLGAKLSRIKREINVYEQQYLSVLQSLNLAKLKQQNLEFQSNIKTVDPPYFPLSAESSKRKLLVAAAGIIGLMMVLFVILVLEYFDNTIKTPARAKKLCGLDLLSAYPRIPHKTNGIDYSFITNRLMEQAVQKMRSLLETEGSQNKKPINVLIFSTQTTDGKSLIQDALSTKLRAFGFSVLSANYRLPDYHPKFSFTTTENENPIEYTLEPSSFTKKSTQEILGKENDISGYDFVLIEIPSITHHAYPPGLVKDADFGILVTRANRSWTTADKISLEGIIQFMKFDPVVLLNGVRAEFLEVLLGELPRKRSLIRKAFKKAVRLQFFEQPALRK